MRWLVVLLIPFVLSGCIDLEETANDDTPGLVDNDDTGETVLLTGSWNVSGYASICPGVTAQYVGDVQSSDGVNITGIQRFGGGSAQLIDIDTCEPMAFGGDYLDYSFTDTPINATLTEFKSFIKAAEAYYYEVPSSYITVSVSAYDDDKIEFSVNFNDGIDNITEYATWTK